MILQKCVAALNGYCSDFDVKMLNTVLFITKAVGKNGAAAEFSYLNNACSA